MIDFKSKAWKTEFATSTGEFTPVVVPTAVYAASSDWGSAEGALPERIDRAAGELSELMRNSDRSSLVRDPFELPAGFSPVGGFGAQ